MPNLKPKQYKIKAFNAPKRQPRGTWTPLTFPNCGQPHRARDETHQLKDRTPPTWRRPISGDLFYAKAKLFWNASFSRWWEIELIQESIRKQIQMQIYINIMPTLQGGFDFFVRRGLWLAQCCYYPDGHWSVSVLDRSSDHYNISHAAPLCPIQWRWKYTTLFAVLYKCLKTIFAVLDFQKWNFKQN